jgi:hypothetical protein
MAQEFEAVFAQIRPLISRHADGNVVETDAPDNYTLLGPKPDEKGRDVWLGSVRIKKSYVSVHLMPVYRFPDLLDAVSSALKKRMQGKSCFNFKSVDNELFEALSELVDRGVERYRTEGLI